MGYVRSRWQAVTRHPVLVVIVALLLIAWVVFGWLIGFAPAMAAMAVFAVIVWWAVLEIIAWRRRRKDDAGQDPAGEARVAILAGIGVVIIGFGLMQVVPYGRDHTAPPVTGEPAWHDATTRTLMVRACFSCHSSEVTYPWYASVAPTSWAVQHHIDEARGAINYSQFATDPGKAGETIEVILEGSMPPAYFTRFGIHPEANLTDAERAALIAGLRKTPGLNEEPPAG